MVPHIYNRSPIDGHMVVSSFLLALLEAVMNGKEVEGSTTTLMKKLPLP